MKKGLFAVTLLLISFSVKASGWDIDRLNSYVMDSSIKESIDCNGKICTSTFIIPSDYNGDEISIVPTIFAEPIDNAMPGDTYEYHIIIKNNSKYDYSYLSSTFYIKPFQSSDTIDVMSYANEKINTGGVMYRLNSSIALMSLYDTNKKLTDEEISDEELDKQLIKKGYKGITELDQYLKDYIGYSSDDLELHSDLVSKALWPNISAMPTVKETNPELIKFGYDYFYNVLFSMHLNKESLDDVKYSIGSWQRDQDLYLDLDNRLVNQTFTNNQEINFSPLYFHINGPLTNNPYVLFEFGLDFGFKLEKINNEETKDDDIPTINQVPTDPVNNDNIRSDIVDEPSSYVDTGIESNILIIIIINSCLLFLFIILKGYFDKHVKEN